MSKQEEIPYGCHADTVGLESTCEAVATGECLCEKRRKKTALAKVGAEYYDKDSPHYLDNERYKHAVSLIK